MTPLSSTDRCELMFCRVKLPKSFLAVNVSDIHAGDADTTGSKGIPDA